MLLLTTVEEMHCIQPLQTFFLFQASLRSACKDYMQVINQRYLLNDDTFEGYNSNQTTF